MPRCEIPLEVNFPLNGEIFRNSEFLIGPKFSHPNLLGKAVKTNCPIGIVYPMRNSLSHA